MTLSKMAHLALSIDEKLGDLDKHVATREQFVEMEKELNQLQAAVPNSVDVRIARLRWFMHGLVTFEENFVEPIVDNDAHWEMWPDIVVLTEKSPPGLIMSWTAIRSHLNHRDLGNDCFASVYPRVENALHVVIMAVQGTEMKNRWTDRYNGLRDDLFRGKI